MLGTYTGYMGAGTSYTPGRDVPWLTGLPPRMTLAKGPSDAVVLLRHSRLRSSMPGPDPYTGIVDERTGGV